jgi:hypothetical protein
MRVRILIMAVALLLGIVLAAMSRHEDQEDRMRLSVSFQAYSNSPSGQKYAVFAVTNLDSCDLQLWNGGTVEFSGSDQKGRYSPGVQVPYSLAGSKLRRGQAYTMITGVPAHSYPWRLSWMVMRFSLANRMADWTSRLPLVPAYRNGTPDFFYVTTAFIP